MNLLNLKCLKSTLVMKPSIVNILPVQKLIQNKYPQFIFNNYLNNKQQDIVLCLTNLWTQSLMNSNLNKLVKQFEKKTKMASPKIKEVYWIPSIVQPLQKIKYRQNGLIICQSYILNGLHEFYHEKGYSFIDISKLYTLEEICSLYPQKVPLSYRKTIQPQIKQKIVERTKNNELDKEPKITDVIIAGCQINIWDQAIQVILDCQNSHIHYISPNYKKINEKSNSYKLNSNDFMHALQATNQLIYGKPLNQRYNLTNYNTFDNIKYIIQKMKNSYKCNEILLQLQLAKYQNQLQKQFEITVKSL